MRTVYRARIGVIASLCVVSLLTWHEVAQADFVYGEATKIPNVSRPGAAGPQISRDGLELCFWYRGESACPGIWVAKRSTTREPWGDPIRLGPPVDSGGPAGGSCISADGLELYFGDGFPDHYVPLGCTANPNGYGGGDLWISKRATKAGPWGLPQNLGPIVNGPAWDDHPSISTDGLSLYFASYRSGTYALWLTTRPVKEAPWGPPAPVSLPVNNMPMYKSTPFISADGLSLYFNYGGYTPDIYVTKRATTASAWGAPVPFAPVNSPSAEWHLSFSEEDSTLYFERADNFYAVCDLWQVKATPVVDFNRDGEIDAADMGILVDNWGRNEPLCDIGPVAWGDGVVDERDLRVLMESLMVPGPQASEVPGDAILRWISPEFADSHDIYFGTSFDAVNSANRVNPLDVLVSMGQPGTAYDPDGLLEYSQTYYWRVDAVVGPADATIYRGPVLSFTTDAFAHPIKNVVARASTSRVNMGPEQTVDGSGLDENDGHSTQLEDMWQSGTVGPHWIEFEFDKVYPLHELWVWNSNQVIEPIIGFGAKSVEIEYSTDGMTWTPLDGVPEFARAPGRPAYTANTIVTFAGVSAKYVKLSIDANWGGLTPSTGLSEVRFFYVPSAAAVNP